MPILWKDGKSANWSEYVISTGYPQQHGWKERPENEPPPEAQKPFNQNPTLSDISNQPVKRGRKSKKDDDKKQ